jgi:hypothetical protein
MLSDVIRAAMRRQAEVGDAWLAQD